MLLLGGDGGPGRDGVRTDTVIVASIDTNTGDTTLFSLPRNLENLPFPPGSPLAQAYPNGFTADKEDEGLLNAVYRNGPIAHPGILGADRQPGRGLAQARRRPGARACTSTTSCWSTSTGSAGWSTPSAASRSTSTTTCRSTGSPGRQLPDDYIAPGPNQHMDGYTALQFARGRYGLTDYDRMDRQRCTIKAIIDAARPGHAAAEVPAARLDHEGHRQHRHPAVGPGRLRRPRASRSRTPTSAASSSTTSLIKPAYPDYDKIRQIVKDTLAPASAPSSASSGSAAPSSPAAPASGGAAPPAATNPVTDVGDACKYDPVRAQQALAAGEPPTQARAESAGTEIAAAEGAEARRRRSATTAAVNPAAAGRRPRLDRHRGGPARTATGRPPSPASSDPGANTVTMTT